MPTDQQLTHEQLAKGESDARQTVELWLYAYYGFPTSDNFDGVLAGLRTYQTAWMNGRKRLPPLNDGG